MQQIHCLLNCMAHGVEQIADVRPLFFGAWDTPFEVNEEGQITYYSKSITNDYYVSMFEHLYRQKLSPWYDYQLTKQENFDLLRLLIDHIEPGVQVLVQLDLFYLRYESRSYQHIHQPHFVILLKEHEGLWLIRDPYFCWEGELTEAEMYSAFCENELGGGFLLDLKSVAAPSAVSVSSHLERELSATNNRLASEVKSLVLQFISQEEERPKERLSRTFSQIGIIAKRKRSYQAAFDYFAESLGGSAEMYNDRVEGLVKGWNGFGFMAIRASMGVTPLNELLQKVERLEQQEKELKQQLWSLYRQWKEVFLCSRYASDS